MSGGEHLSMTSPTADALDIARKTRDNLIDGSIKTTSALRACKTICSLLKREEQNEWIDLELNGYLHKFKTVGDMEKDLPKYRLARCIYLDENDHVVQIDDRFSFFNSYPIGEPIAELETNIKTGVFIVGGPSINQIRENFPSVIRAHVSDMSFVRVLNAVNNIMLEFLNNIILELGYVNVYSGIFEETRTSVDTELMKLSRPALQNLVATYQKLTTISTSLEYSQEAFACRQILQDFTDAIFKREYLGGRNCTYPRANQEQASLCP
jgi:hypothetical protein